MQETLTMFEKEILEDIHDLPLPFQEKIARMVHLLRKEFIPSDLPEAKITEEFLTVCGAWKDARTVAEQLDDIYASRSSTSRSEQAF